MDADLAQPAARALLAFWRAAGVDMDEAEAVYAAAPAAAPARAANAPVSKPKPKAKTPDAPVETAKAMAASARTIAELRAAVENFDGCALKKTARNTVFSDGVDDAPVLLIGLSCRPALRLNSWDRALLPLPFGRGAIVWDEARYPEGADVADVAADWAARLTAVEAEADRLTGLERV